MKLTAIILYNYGPLCRETSRFVNLRGKTTPPRVDKSGCFHINSSADLKTNKKIEKKI
jgi:hypothetical protein